MANLIKLTRAESHDRNDRPNEITLGVYNILMIEEAVDPEPGRSRILLENGKTLYVEEDQDEIRDLANQQLESGGILG